MSQLIKTRLYRIIERPILSEHAMRLADEVKQFAFYVVKDATKREVKEAVEQLFNVEVKSVRVLNTKGKARRVKNRLGRTRSQKKAYVALRAGHDISFASV